MDNLKLKVSNNVINHLGLNLYNSLPAVLSELIANSYDADASRVKINIKKENGKTNIYVYDNGIGMSRKDFNDKYLEVAKDSRKKEELSGKRLKMGRKGLGKLSIYAISDTVCIFTKTINSDLTAVEINYKSASEENDYSPHEFVKEKIPNEILDWFKENNQGTVTLINSCKRNFNKITLNGLPKEIEKNFYLVLDNPEDKFNIYIKTDYFNDKLSSSEPDFNCDFTFSLNNNNNNNNNNSNNIFLTDDLKEQWNKKWKDQNLSDDDDDELFFAKVFNKNKKKHEKIEIIIKGWIGTLISIKGYDKNVTGVPIIVRNRIVNNNIIKDFNIKRFWSNYFVGKLVTEYMDNDDFEDIISPNRQGFDSNVDDRYEKTKFIINEIINCLIKLKDNKDKEEKSEKKLKIAELNKNFSIKINSLGIPKKYHKDLLNNYVDTTGLKVINEDYIIFISHCSEKKCPKSYWISKYLFDIINPLTKTSNDIKIKRLVYSSDKNDSGRIKPNENIYVWMKDNALNEKFPNAIFISCLSNDFIRNWNTTIEFGASWAVDKKNYSFLYDRDLINSFAVSNGITGEPLNLDKQNFDFKSKDNLFKNLSTFLFDIFNEKISLDKIEKVIENIDYKKYKIDDICSNCNQ